MWYAWSMVSLLLHAKTSCRFIYQASLKHYAVGTNFIHKDDFEGHNTYLDVFYFFKNLDKIDNMLSGGILRDD